MANSWNTRTGSSELSTVTALVSRMRSGARRGGGEHHRRGGDGEVGPVVLADAEHVQADLVGELDLLQEVGQPLLGAGRAAGRRVPQDVAEGVDAQFHAPLPSSSEASILPVRAPARGAGGPAAAPRAA